MTSLVPVAVNSTRSLAYRAIEVEQIQKRNMMLALAISITIHALIISCYFLLPSGPIDMTRVEWGRSILCSLPPSIQTPNYVPQGSIGGPKITDVHAGEVVPIPDVEADPTRTLATQKELAKGITFGPEATGEGTGDPFTGTIGSGVPPVEVDEEPPPYRAVEQQPVLVRRVAPKYPELMLRAEVEGKVTVNIWVDKEGKPHDVRILKGDNEAFNDAALEAARQFLFTPAYMNSGPVSVWVSVPFKFQLR